MTLVISVCNDIYQTSQLHNYSVINCIIKMNGLHIAGKKIQSPVPAKKQGVTTTQIKQKQTQVTKPAVKKPSVPVQSQKSAQTQKKGMNKKIQQKPQKKQQQQKKIQPKVEQPLPVKQQEKVVQKVVQSQPQPQPIKIFQVMVRYNHYKQKFQCKDNILSFMAPNEKYCFALVFKGNYQPVLRNFKTREIIEPITTGKAEQFSWKVDQNEVYQVQIQEDQTQQAKYQRHVYKAPEKEQTCPLKKKNQRAQQLTEDMKKMGIDELGGEKHRQMLQQRQLQDILFS